MPHFIVNEKIKMTRNLLYSTDHVELITASGVDNKFSNVSRVMPLKYLINYYFVIGTVCSNVPTTN